MRLVDTLLFYLLFSSAALIYGMGILPALETSLSDERLFLRALKMYCVVVATVVLTFLMRRFLLAPLDLGDLYPLVALLIFITFAVFFEIIVQLTARNTCAEFALPYLAILLALDEGNSLSGSILTSIAALTSYYALVPVLRLLGGRLALFRNADPYGQKIGLLLCMFVLMLALYSLDSSWLVFAVGK